MHCTTSRPKKLPVWWQEGETRMDFKLLTKLGRVTQEEQRLRSGEAIDRSIYSSSSNFVILSDKMIESGKLIAFRPHTRFADFPEHTHNYVEIMYMCSGSTRHMLNGRLPIHLKDGELLFLNQYVSHSIKRAEFWDVAINFLVLPKFFNTTFEMIGSHNVLGRFLAGCLQHESSDIDYLHFVVSDIQPIQNLMENLVWSILERQPNNRRITEVTMGLLFLQLLNYTGRLAFPDKQTDNSLVLNVLQEIEENYHMTSLTAMAEAYHVSLAYLSSLVKKSTGSTFRELLRQKRLTKAADLLKTTDLSIHAIISLVGYENSSYFYHAFYRQFGMDPKTYRSQVM